MHATYLAPKENLDGMEIVILDSSKPSKFSKHCIIKIPGVMFKNNYYCGAFIRQFQVHIIEKYGSKDVNPYFVYADTPSSQMTIEFRQFLIDMVRKISFLLVINFTNFISPFGSPFGSGSLHQGQRFSFIRKL